MNNISKKIAQVVSGTGLIIAVQLSLPTQPMQTPKDNPPLVSNQDQPVFKQPGAMSKEKLTE